MCNVKKRIMAVQGQFRVNGSSKVIDFGTNRKHVCDFLFVINSNLGPILHCFGDTAAYRSKNCNNRPFVAHHSLINRPHSGRPLENFSTSHTLPESEIMGLSDGEDSPF